MSYTSILSERAHRELSNAWKWYEKRQPGLGDRFKEIVFKKLKVLEKDPSKGMQRKSPYREAVIKVFSYLIIYRIEIKSKQIFVQSIFHTRRNPKKKYRLKS
jgi:plasmid stabilization system protein ParE